MCSKQTLEKLFVILLPCWIIAVIAVESTARWLVPKSA